MPITVGPAIGTATTPTVTAVAQVYFDDYSASQWHIGTEGVAAWNDAPNYFRPYRVDGGSCDGDAVHCVPVRSANYGATGWHGQT